MPHRAKLGSFDSSVHNLHNRYVAPADSTAYLDAQRQEFELVNEVCMLLFDEWCDRRNVVALTYLMHGWPIVGCDVVMVRRLLRSLRELEKYHYDALAEREILLLSLLWKHVSHWE